MAERTDVSANYIARIELGLRAHSLRTVVRLAEALETKVSDIVADENEKWSSR